jgi:hypothetical protein
MNYLHKKTRPSSKEKTMATVKKTTESTKLSKKNSASLVKGVKKIVAESKVKAKQEVAKKKIPKDNFITRMGR